MVVGTNVRVCQEDLNWSGEKPVCNIAGKFVVGNQPAILNNFAVYFIMSVGPQPHH